ncbi:MAG TPA: YihY/virulence factor BrkB family protein [Saprospiraceae bacterium]|nr:YihY/virulence factor BrkB family protein [Saprospiraceae bacterium]HQW55781.1 YihY/virulence factor BrkB family protein [Saprospiraceae bacterium]
MRKKTTFGSIWRVLKQTFKGFSEDRVAKYAASLAYYTLFAIGPLMVMIIASTAIFFDREVIENKIYAILVDFIGIDAANQIDQVIKNAYIDATSVKAVIIGVVTLLLGATGVFGEIQDSINRIWGIKAKPKKGWLKFLLNRLLSFSIIITLGFLLLVSLVVSGAVEALSGMLQAHYPDVTVVLFYIFNLILTLGISFVIFAIIFKVLPDAKIKWRDVIAGAVVTAILFMLGKFGISFYLSKSKVGTTFGSAGSIIILLAWIYYSSIILYLGAEFTKAYALEFGDEIHPNDYAVTTKEVVVETGSMTVQEKEAEVGDINDKPAEEKLEALKSILDHPKT